MYHGTTAPSSDGPQEGALIGSALISRGAFLSKGPSQGALLKTAAETQAKMNEFDARPPNPRLQAKSFSGGNQQKIVVAREIERNPDLLLVGQPTLRLELLPHLSQEPLRVRSRPGPAFTPPTSTPGVSATWTTARRSGRLPRCAVSAPGARRST